MIPGRLKQYTKAEFKKGVPCGMPGCLRQAHHEWSFGCCALNNFPGFDGKGRWMALCDECDIAWNRQILQGVGVAPHLIEEILTHYQHIQPDLHLGL